MNDSLSWVKSWSEVLDFPTDLPPWFYAMVSLFCIFFLIVFPCAALLSFLQKKMSADFQARVGPNRAGPSGMLQPLADLFKLLQKDPQQEWSWRENFWLCLHTMALYSTLAVLPLGTYALLVDAEMSAFLPFWSALVLALGTMLLGLSQGSVPGWFGGIRMAAQTLAGSFPALISLLCIGVQVGSFRWSVVASSQGFSPWAWSCFSNPFQPIAFVVFVMSGLVLLAVPPLDGALSTADIHGGVVSHLSGRRLSLFRFGRFYSFFFWSVITVVLFLGAWVLPEGLVSALRNNGALPLLSLLELIWLLLKTVFLMSLIVWIACVNPRSRVDQITNFTWNVLSPFSLFALVGSGIWVGWKAFL